MFVRNPSDVRVTRWGFARGILWVLTIVTAVVSASTLIVGPWRLAPFGVQLISVSTPIKPLNVSLGFALALALTSPTVRRAYLARSIIGFYAVAGFIMWLFSLGPAPTLMGRELMYRGPYALLMYLPGFNSLRVPARFWMTVTLCLAVIGAMVFARLTERLGRIRLAAAGCRSARRPRRHLVGRDAAGRDAEAISGAELRERRERASRRVSARTDLP